MATPASGAAVLFGLRRELAEGVPNTALSRVWHQLDLPVGLDLARALTAALESDARGFGVRGMPGPITGPVDIGIPLRASTWLEMEEHVLGGKSILVKSTLETGAVYQYVGTPTRVNGDTSFDALLHLPPVYRHRTSGIKLSSITIPVGPGEIPARMAGLFMHDTQASTATQASGTGTYTEGPDVRGLIRRPRTGEKVHIKATRTVAGGGLQWKAERVPSGGTATFPGAAIDAAYDSAGNGEWQNVVAAYQLTGTVSVGAAGTAVTGVGTLFLTEVTVGQTITIAGENRVVSAIASNLGLTLATAHTAGASAVVAHLLLQDVGKWDENRDTFDLIFPATTTEQGDIALNDIWTFEVKALTDPTPTYISGQRFTSAHWSVYWRRQGATSWVRLSPEGNGQIVIAWPLTASQGWGTRHYTGSTRDGMLAPTLQFARKFIDVELLDLAEAHEPFELYAIAEGGSLGSGAYRESIRLDTKAAEITGRGAPISAAGAVIETLNIAFKASAAGDPPLTTTTITDRNYTVAA